MTATTTNPKTFEIRTSADMHTFGARLAGVCQAGDVLFLIGELGAGKTVLARGLIEELSENTEDVTSPTYNLVHVWPTPNFEIWHSDLYRLQTPEQVRELGLEDAFSRALCLIEWPDRMGNMAPQQRLDILIKTRKTGRQVTLRPSSAHWENRLHGF